MENVPDSKNERNFCKFIPALVTTTGVTIIGGRFVEFFGSGKGIAMTVV